AVTLVTAPDHVAPALARCPELMVRGITHRRDLAPLLARADAVLLGPGLGLDGWARQLFGAVLEARLPTVFDADGLTLLGEPGPRALPFPALLTPHPGEAGRLLGCPTAAVESDRFAAAAALAQGYGAPTVLKGAGAIIASEAGLAVSLGGNSGWRRRRRSRRRCSFTGKPGTGPGGTEGRAFWREIFLTNSDPCSRPGRNERAGGGPLAGE
ncbi:MAG: hypothetical protein EBU29_09380, partial [Gammaproteobacteria bacterium]|nr:hypothetical protein [Gammaproteobacteria bacterium]